MIRKMDSVPKSVKGQGIISPHPKKTNIFLCVLVAYNLTVLNTVGYFVWTFLYSRMLAVGPVCLSTTRTGFSWGNKPVFPVKINLFTYKWHLRKLKWNWDAIAIRRNLSCFISRKLYQPGTTQDLQSLDSLN